MKLPESPWKDPGSPNNDPMKPPGSPHEVTVKPQTFFIQNMGAFWKVSAVA